MTTSLRALAERFRRSAALVSPAAPSPPPRAPARRTVHRNPYVEALPLADGTANRTAPAVLAALPPTYPKKPLTLPQARDVLDAWVKHLPGYRAVDTRGDNVVYLFMYGEKRFSRTDRTFRYAQGKSAPILDAANTVISWAAEQTGQSSLDLRAQGWLTARDVARGERRLVSPAKTRAGENMAGQSFAGQNLDGFDLRNANLTGADLRRASLVGAQLAGANLTNASLAYASLRNADLTGANLTGANLEYATLVGTKARGADLRNANMTEAYLARAKLERADLRGAVLRSTNFEGASMTEADLRGAQVSRVVLRKADLRDADLRETDLNYPNIIDADLRGALRNESDPPIPGWKVLEGKLYRRGQRA
jgi:uncharacterized protein YjbI with pentapeptide repeats